MPDRTPEDDETRIYRPYGSPPPDEADDTPASGETRPDPFAADPFAPAPSPSSPAPKTADPFAPANADPSADPFRDPFAAEAPSPPPTPPPAAAPEADPFAPPASGETTPDPFAAPPVSDEDPFGLNPTPPPPTRSTSDPFAAPPETAPPSTPDPFAARTPEAGDPFAAPPEARTPEATPPRPAEDPFGAPFAPPPQPASQRPQPAVGPAPDPFAASPTTESNDPFAALRGSDRGLSADSGLESSLYEPYGGGVDLPAPFDSEETLAGAFTPVFSLALQIRASDDLGDPTALRSRTQALLHEAVDRARTLRIPDGDIEEARFALVAFLDEAILGTEWPGRDSWSSEPLQLALYDRYDAGERFFDRLKAILDEGGTRKAVLEVYYLCLALGFKGRYAIHGRDVLRRLVDDLHSRLETGSPPGPLSPRGTSREVPAEAERDGLPTWALWVGAAVLVLLLYAGLAFSLSGAAGEASEQIQALSSQAE